jgi:hypothetical protein
LPQKCEQSTNISPLKAYEQSIVKRGEDGRLSMSLYIGEPASRDQLKNETKRLLLAFPRIEETVILTIIERAEEKGYPIQRIIDGINHTIDTCEYLNFVPAKVLNYDLKCRLYSYNEACDIFTKTQNMKALLPMTIRGTRVYVSPADKAKYNLPDIIH